MASCWATYMDSALREKSARKDLRKGGGQAAGPGVPVVSRVRQRLSLEVTKPYEGPAWHSKRPARGTCGEHCAPPHTTTPSGSSPPAQRLVLGAVHERDVARAQDHLGVGVEVQQQRVLAAGRGGGREEGAGEAARRGEISWAHGAAAACPRCAHGCCRLHASPRLLCRCRRPDRRPSLKANKANTKSRPAPHLLWLNTCRMVAGSVTMTVNLVTMEFTLSPGNAYARCLSQNAWGSFTMSTMPPRKGTVTAGPAGSGAEARRVSAAAASLALLQLRAPGRCRVHMRSRSPPL
jgi:hypothetical protein